MILIVGLGNPGEEYVNTRHNVGRMVLDAFSKTHELKDWQLDNKLKALKVEAKIGKNKALFLKPETFMNKSGITASKIIKSKLSSIKCPNVLNPA